MEGGSEPAEEAFPCCAVLQASFQGGLCLFRHGASLRLAVQGRVARLSSSSLELNIFKRAILASAGAVTLYTGVVHLPRCSVRSWNWIEQEAVASRCTPSCGRAHPSLYVRCWCHLHPRMNMTCTDRFSPSILTFSFTSADGVCRTMLDVASRFFQDNSAMAWVHKDLLPQSHSGSFFLHWIKTEWQRVRPVLQTEWLHRVQFLLYIMIL